MTLPSRHMIRNSNPGGLSSSSLLLGEGGGPRVVVSTAAFHARVRGSFPGLGGLKETKMFLPHPLVKLEPRSGIQVSKSKCVFPAHL